MKKIYLISIASIILILLCLKIFFYHNTLNSNEKFQSRRLGNVIDLWYSGSITKNSKILTELPTIDTVEKDSLSRYLIKNLKVYQTLEKDNIKELYQEANNGCVTYYYKNIVKLVNNFSYNLVNILEEYDKINNNVLYEQNFEDENHCVIHYRLGDVVTLGDVIDYKDIIKSMKELNVKFSVVEIMDGGKSHKSNPFHNFKSFLNVLDNHEMKESEKIYQDFYQTLKKSFPESKVIQSVKRKTDEDFYRMASAPILITGGGSYAATAAIGGKARIIRTPACKTLDFPSKGCMENLEIPKNSCDWKTYQYNML